VATIWPKDTTEEQKKKRNVPHAEIFKMPGGTEYIIHDVDEKNHIVGKARVSGHVVVPESMSVEGFGGHSILDDIKLEMQATGTKEETEKSESSHQFNELIAEPPPSFHPPSFGVTVLGNSHGFDKSGSVSGYVLWINGRGVMIDPPPYSSATLERQGIRPRTIVGIILTHCHADHDAGAFQKVLTGTPVVVITTPTIYKSFIRKYAALSALSPALLRHSHRYKPAIIGEPLRFQGATFHFIYSLHTIPCVGFRVEWRGRSIVFTADHFNYPPGMQKLEESGVLTKARADDLRSLALQECDVLLHEAGAPPIHTPLEVLMQLPKEVKKRLYVVHTSALPEGCGLRVAPTGTKGTIRLDQLDQVDPFPSNMLSSRNENKTSSFSCGDDGYAMNSQHEYGTIKDDAAKASANRGADSIHSSFAHLEVPVHRKGRNSVYSAPRGAPAAPPAVALRPPSSTDAWFILNLLSAVPFISRYVDSKDSRRFDMK
jgi:glyoxylase-like metal-dependent hydrolase (beta-lactamase superfamily II)